MTGSQERALNAAVTLVGTAGLRALTHSRVDAQAGLPPGSTSNYFRTRAALLSGVINWIVEREMSEISPAMQPASTAELIELICALINITTTQERTVTTARLVLFMEAAHNPTLRASVSQGRNLIESSVIGAFTRLGAVDPETAAAAVMACAEGVILHRIARGDESDPRPAIALVVSAAFAPVEPFAPAP